MQHALKSIEQMMLKLAADQEQLAADQEQLAADQEQLAAGQERLAAGLERLAAGLERLAAGQERQDHLLQASLSEERLKMLKMRESTRPNCVPNPLPEQRGRDHISHFLYYLFLSLLNCLLFTLILRAFPSLQLLLL